MSEVRSDFGWTHRTQPPAGGTPRGVLFLLHGTGGDETSLLELGAMAAPDHLLVGVRGRSDEEGVTRYFRRYDALHYDQDHLASEADALAAFIAAAAQRYGARALPRRALGYSNGANVALAAALRNPGRFAGLALLRAVQPFEQPPTPDLTGLSVLLLAGRHDPYSVAGRSLPDYLAGLGATVDAVVQEAGHGLTGDDIAQLTRWFAALG